MSKFTKINDTALIDIQMSDFADFFTQHIFFKFMDSGRSGLEQGVKDLIDTSLGRVIDSIEENKSGTVVVMAPGLKRIEKLKSSELFNELLTFHLPRITSGFITGGTKEMRSAIFNCATDPLMFER